MASEGEYESVLCVKQDINVYKIPPRASNRGYRASDWKLEQPDWTGRLRITARGKVAYIKLEDKASGELFAQAPVIEFPGITVETVSDSSRYFVIRIQDGNGRSAFIGIGFNDRGDAFDFNVSLQDHFKWVKQENEISKESQNKDTGPKLDLGFKEGQTITLNIGQTKRRDGKPRLQGAVGFGLLPPPPGGKIALPSSTESPNHIPEPVALNSAPRVAAEDTGSLLDLDAPDSVPSVPAQSLDTWGDFSAPASSVPAQNKQSTNWVQF
ncbi:adaptin ear-binding coat-associated protein 1-like [Polyodon spathula]|uniref:adaptin ear-binding coat-associated protein 1-like n=2 Tax=Polyodon spathula TaxID=7913 RepID=UPI001B7E26E6|nr:adaptin ear-binding coat-associated protein 1-like [Polyodon spathula]